MIEVDVESGVRGEGVEIFFIMMRRAPRTTQSGSSAASDVDKREGVRCRASRNARQ